MILTGPEIRKRFDAGDIRISPFNERQLNPASYDLRLGSELAVYQGCVVPVERSGVPMVLEDGRDFVLSRYDYLDAKKEMEVNRFQIDPVQGWLLKPGILYLMHTKERIHTKKLVTTLDGKSSIGRLGIVIHLTAAYGDPGFDGQYTLEVTCVHPVKVYAGMRFCQARFHTTEGPSLDYAKTGHYTGSKAVGPVPSMSWKQFKEDR